MEHVSAGSRLRVFIVKDSCLTTFLLAGAHRAHAGVIRSTMMLQASRARAAAVRTARTRRSTATTRWPTPARACTSTTCVIACVLPPLHFTMQVELEIEDVDRNGAYVGHVYVNKKNLAGLCCCRPFPARC